MLSPAEWGIVTQVGAAATIEEIRNRLTLDEFQVRQAVQRLVSEGLLEIEEARDEQPATAGQPAEGDLRNREPAAVGTATHETTAKSGLLPRLFGRKSA